MMLALYDDSWNCYRHSAPSSQTTVTKSIERYAPSPQVSVSSLREHDYEDIQELRAKRSSRPPSCAPGLVPEYSYTQCPAYETASGEVTTKIRERRISQVVGQIS